MTLSELAQSVSWPWGLLLDEADLDALAIVAARHMLGWGRIAAIDGPVTYDDPTDPLFAPRSIPYLGPSDAPGVIFAGIDYGTGTRAGDSDAGTPAPAPAPTPTPPPELSEGTVITASEWALIKPLFQLYVERENARALEASRGMGVDVYGRTVSEIQSDIERYENGDMPRLTFFQPVETI